MGGGGRTTWRALALGAIATLALASQLVLGAAPAAAADPLQADTISVGAGHTCALRASGQAVCWGSNFYGQAGDGTTSIANKSPTPVTGLDDAVELSAGAFHTCAIRASGGTVCWGRNHKGQLGNGGTENQLLPVPVELEGAAQISAGFAHTCAIRSNEEALCWGLNEDGELGDGTETDRLEPTPVLGLTDAAQISAGGSTSYGNTCAIRSDEEALCWGANELGQVGDNTETKRTVPTAVEGLSDAAQISMGNGHACAIRSDEEALCWGSNSTGQLGDGLTTGFASLVPAPVEGLADAAQISAGSTHSCGIRSSGEALCWGGNTFGELGDGTTETHDVPEAVTGLADAAQIVASSGGIHACAIRNSGEALCWGNNGTGQLGDGTIENRSLPTTVLEVESPPAPEPESESGPDPNPNPQPVLSAPSVTPLIVPPVPPAPEAGVRANATLVSGVVRVRRPGSAGFVPLVGTESIPIGSLVDTRAGRVRIVSAADRTGGTREADFYGGIFKLLQGKAPGAVTEVRLAGSLRCGPTAKGAAASAKGPRGRLVWGSGAGAHRSTGRFSSATVRGTRWLVHDRCDNSTLTRVAEGSVTVRDFAKDSTALLRKGQSYVAKPPRLR